MSSKVHKKLFRIIPPKDMVESILRSSGLIGVHDLRWFSKDELKLDEQEEWLVQLYPFYLALQGK